MVEEPQKTMAELSGKLVLLFEILRMAHSVGDKVLVKHLRAKSAKGSLDCLGLSTFFFAFRLVFSQSLLSLDLIEDFLAYKTEEAEKKKSPRKVRTPVPTNCMFFVQFPEQMNKRVFCIIC